jgi:ABC-type branched-subunit amino acid transport system permease subunit
MLDDEKRRFDALQMLSEQYWRDWDHKSQAEWRLSFGVWVALLAAAAAVGKSEINLGWGLVLAVGVFVTVLHFVFLQWIQTVLTENREVMRRSQKAMADLAGVDLTIKPRRSWFKQESLWTQLGITVLLVLVMVVVSLHPSEPRLHSKPSLKVGSPASARP